jgi:hypothetical protein
MKVLISEPITKLAQIIIHKIKNDGFDQEDIAILKMDGPNYLRKVAANIKLGKPALTDLSDTEKKVLLAYVIFLRQNVTMEFGDKPNEEDAAKILHGEVYEGGKGNAEELEKELLKQLEKIGLDVHKNDKKDKGDKK